ncbi:hypothetical protein CR513_46298, partial [Mucuna pruriens]
MEMDLVRDQIVESTKATMARRQASGKPYSSSSWEGKEREKKRSKRDKVPKKENKSSLGQKEDIAPPLPSSSKSSNIKCFKCFGKEHIASKCPNRRTMVLRENRKVKSESSHEETSSNSECESSSERSHYERDFLMVRRFMSSQVVEEVENQRENIFHSKCLVIGVSSIQTKLTRPCVASRKSNSCESNQQGFPKAMNPKARKVNS